MNIVKVDDCYFKIKNPESDLVQSDLSKGIYWETNQLHITFKIIEKFPIKNIVIIGAHIGSLAIPIAKRLTKRDGQVYAFEPSSENCKHFRENIGLNNLKNITVYEEAIGNDNGHCYITGVTENKSQNHHIWTDNDIKNHRRSSPSSSNYANKVVMKKLDDCDIPEYDLIIIDVEGMEIEVFQGGIHSIKKNNPFIICELWMDHKRLLENMEFTQEMMIRMIQNQFNVILAHSYNDDHFFIPIKWIKLAYIL